MFLFYQPDTHANHLTEDDSRHAARVLRLAVGDSIEVTDGQGHLHHAVIEDIDIRKVTYRAVSTEALPKKSYTIHLAIAPTKNIDRMEWLVEKCVELGVDRISFVRCQTSERKEINTERLSRIVVSALKQSRQAWAPEIIPMDSFERFIRATQSGQKFIAYIDPSNAVTLQKKIETGSAINVLVGPEGDFTPEEVILARENGWLPVSLGPTRLRTETAGLSAVLTVHILNTPA